MTGRLKNVQKKEGKFSFHLVQKNQRAGFTRILKYRAKNHITRTHLPVTIGRHRCRTTADMNENLHASFLLQLHSHDYKKGTGKRLRRVLVQPFSGSSGDGSITSNLTVDFSKYLYLAFAGVLQSCRNYSQRLAF